MLSLLKMIQKSLLKCFLKYVNGESVIHEVKTSEYDQEEEIIKVLRILSQ